MTYGAGAMRPLVALGLVMALPACGAKPETNAASVTVEADAGSAEADDASIDGGGQGPAGAITAVDAGRGGGTLPPDSDAPSTYDLARARATRGKDHPETDGSGSIRPMADDISDATATPADTPASGDNAAATAAAGQPDRP